MTFFWNLSSYSIKCPIAVLRIKPVLLAVDTETFDVKEFLREDDIKGERGSERGCVAGKRCCVLFVGEASDRGGK